MSENNGWLPIETVPRDFEVELGHYSDIDEVWFWRMTGEVGSSGRVWCDFMDDFFDGKNFQAPTHWRNLDPLPPPPETHTQEA